MMLGQSRIVVVVVAVNTIRIVECKRDQNMFVLNAAFHMTFGQSSTQAAAVAESTNRFNLEHWRILLRR